MTAVVADVADVAAAVDVEAVDVVVDAVCACASTHVPLCSLR